MTSPCPSCAFLFFFHIMSDWANSWNTIHDTTNVTDNEVAQRYRGTALYLTLSILRSKPDWDFSMNVSPDMALVVPSREEVLSRWPGKPLDEAEALMVDYDHERDTLGEINLEAAYQRVMELVEEDASMD